MIDVSWCVSADHGGIPQFRLCDDEGLVSAVTTPDKPPSLADLEALEQCFQRGLLRCDDVPGQDCSQVEVCGEYAADWGACADNRTKIPIFVSEWGTSSYSGDGGVCQCEAKEFLDVFSDTDGSGGVTLSMAQWSWADKSESSAALAPGACRNGGDWDSLSESGAFLRAYVRDAMRA